MVSLSYVFFIFSSLSILISIFILFFKKKKILANILSVSQSQLTVLNLTFLEKKTIFFLIQFKFVFLFVKRLSSTRTSCIQRSTSIYDFYIRATWAWNWSTTTGWTCKIRPNIMDGIIWWRRRYSWPSREYWI